jgi:tetratricopeptide (TPR) repeat protein
LLAPVVRDDAKTLSAKKTLDRAEELKEKGQFVKSIENYLLAIKICPAFSLSSYNEIGVMYARMGNLEQAVEAFNKAIIYNGESKYKINVARIYYSLGAVLENMNKPVQAIEQFRKAAEEFRRGLTENPTNSENWNALGDTLAATGDFEAAAEAFKKAQDLNPAAGDYYDNLVRALEYDGRYDEAIEVLKTQIQLAKYNKQDKTVLQLRKHIESIKYKNSKGRWPN